MHKFKVGDRVKYAYIAGDNDKYSCPLWGGRHGYILATVTNIDKDHTHVTFDNGMTDYFYHRRFELATLEDKLIALIYPLPTKYKKVTMSKFLRRGLFVAAAVFAIDVVFFKKRALKALKVSIDKAIDKALT